MSMPARSESGVGSRESEVVTPSRPVVPSTRLSLAASFWSRLTPDFRLPTHVREARRRENIGGRGAHGCQDTAVDGDQLPGDVAGIIGGEKDCRAAQLRRLADATHGNRFTARLLHLR